MKQQQGKLVRWNDDRGFGFVRPDTAQQEVFIHMTAFRQSGCRRPRAGDRISYQTHSEHSGKGRVVNARIEGLSNPSMVDSSTRRSQPKIRPRVPGLGWLTKGLMLLILLMLGGFAVHRYPLLSSHFEILKRLPESSATGGGRFSCQGKVYCSEMGSCREAIFYLQHCPGTKMDGDDDGIPCERQWCGH